MSADVLVAAASRAVAAARVAVAVGARRSCIGIVDGDDSAGSAPGHAADRRPTSPTRRRPSATRAAVRRSWRASTPRSSTGSDVRGRQRVRDAEVPLDYADPDGDDHRPRAAARSAGEPASAVGSLVVNPGGPGAPGTDYAAAAGRSSATPLLDAFDIVGFDPRGTGESTPVDCLHRRRARRVPRRRPRPRRRRRGARVRRRRLARVRRGLRSNSRRPGRPRHHGRGRAGHGHAAGRAGRATARLPRRVVRHLARRDVRRAVPRAGRPAGARRRGRLSLDNRAAGARARPTGFETALRAYVEDCVEQRATASSATGSTRGWPRIAGCSTTSTPARCRPATTAS